MITLCLRKVEIIAMASRGLCNIKGQNPDLLLSRSAFTRLSDIYTLFYHCRKLRTTPTLKLFYTFDRVTRAWRCWVCVDDILRRNLKSYCYSVRTWNFVIWLCLSLLWIRRKIHSSAQLLNLDKSSENAWYFELRHIMNEPSEKCPLIYYHRI